MYRAPDSVKSFICTTFFFKQHKSTDEWQLFQAADIEVDASSPGPAGSMRISSSKQLSSLFLCVCGGGGKVRLPDFSRTGFTCG